MSWWQVVVKHSATYAIYIILIQRKNTILWFYSLFSLEPILYYRLEKACYWELYIKIVDCAG